MFRHAGMVLALGSIFALGSAMPAAWAHGTTERVSVSSGGAQGNGYSFDPAISADGRFVAFASDATNLVPGDTNSTADVFVRDRQTGTTRRVSVSSGGAQGNDVSSDPAISADGRFVAFKSDATNLVPGDTNDSDDIFVHDRQTGTTRRVSVSSGGAQGNGDSLSPAISADGRFVAFESCATNLVPGDTNDAIDVFVHDRQTGTTRAGQRQLRRRPGQWQQLRARRSRRTGASSPSASVATNLVPGDTNDASDVFVHDRQTGTTRAGQRQLRRRPGQWRTASARRSRRTGASSPSCRSPTTWCRATPTSGTTSLSATARRARPSGSASAQAAPRAMACSCTPAISADGRFVAFCSDATNLVPGDTNGHGRRLRPRPPDGQDPAGQRQLRRRPGQWRQLRPGDLGGRALRRLRLGCHQPGAGRHQRRGRRLCPHLSAIAA